MLTRISQILGDSITSPPRTPSPGGNSLQPSPREPAYTALTYKPPSLYPNKKQRTEPLAALASSYSYFAPSSTLEPQHQSSGRSHVHFPPISHLDARRGSLHTVSASHSAARHYQTPDQTPTSAVMEPFPRMSTFVGAVQDPFARELRDSFAYADEHSSSRKSSTTSGHSTYPARTYEREVPKPQQYHQVSHYSIPVRDSYPEHRERTRYQEQQTRTMNGFGQHGYSGNVPAFFMPSQYEYQHGKARKRSNLPKQSTEIMKTWFDQVPFPVSSELIALADIWLRTSQIPILVRNKRLSSQAYVCTVSKIRSVTDLRSGDWN